jgi:hypothetical protein
VWSYTSTPRFASMAWTTTALPLRVSVLEGDEGERYCLLEGRAKDTHVTVLCSLLILDQKVRNDELQHDSVDERALALHASSDCGRFRAG